MDTAKPRWFQQFQVEPEDRSDADVIWADDVAADRASRPATRAEKAAILAVGVIAIGLIVVMIVTLLVAIYISRR